MKLRFLYFVGVVIPLLQLPVHAQVTERSPREVQQALTDLGFKPGIVDGIWGKRSTEALRAFQTGKGLQATGQIDAGTLEALFPAPPPAVEAAPVLTDALRQPETPPGPLAPVSPVVRGDRLEEIGRPSETPSLPPPTPREPAASEARGPQTASSPAQTPSATKQDAGSGWSWPKLLIFLGILIWIMKKLRKTKDIPADAGTASMTSRNKLSPLSVVATNPAVGRAPLGSENDILTTIQEPSSPSNWRTSLADHDNAVKAWVSQNGGRASRTEAKPLFRSPSPSSSSTSAVSSTGWLPKGHETTVGGVKISGGMIYVGSYLPKQGRPHEMENCLIDPKGTVTFRGDPLGSTMTYWPSYSYMTPEARRSYLEWLSGSRSDPNTYIGYVFLYFYGLERRLMLEKDAPDAADIVDEIRRLMGIYGGNHSFNRYAMDLLTAVELQSGEPSTEFLARVEPNGFEVPTAIKIALGIRVRDDRAIEPDLLYRFALTHPETRVRTPAKRVPDLFQQLYAMRFAEEYPNGFRYKAGRVKVLQKRYKSCSGTFEVDVEVFGGGLPDITHRAEPIGTARRIFDACSNALDDYSRALGRLPGFAPNLNAVARLPEAFRRSEAERIAGQPLARLTAIMEADSRSTVADISNVAGFDLGEQASKPRLRELSQALAAFGYGTTFDPAYSAKTTAGDPARLFPLSGSSVSEPSEAYRMTQLAVMLGLAVGNADGDISESERASLSRVVSEREGLSEDDRNRLRAEIQLYEKQPDRLDDWMRKLKDVPPSAKDAITSALVSVASADGNLQPSEIRKLETIFKRMGLEQSALYEKLHVGSDAPARHEPSRAHATADRTTRIDLSRLQSIRSETSVTANVLADIFAEDEPEDALPIIVESVIDAVPSDVFDGLEQRYGALLDELQTRSTWSAEDFSHLVRDAGLMAGAAREAINDWSLDRFDELMIEGEDPIEIAVHLLPNPISAASVAESREGMPA